MVAYVLNIAKPVPIPTSPTQIASIQTAISTVSTSLIQPIHRDITIVCRQRSTHRPAIQ